MPAHSTAFRVYYEDTDAGGVMYHARYLAFAERGRAEALRSTGAASADLMAEHGIALVVRRAAIEYLRPLRLDDLVTVTTAILDLRAVSLRLRQTLESPAGTAAEIAITLAVVRLRDMRPVRLPEPWIAAIAGLGS